MQLWRREGAVTLTHSFIYLRMTGRGACKQGVHFVAIFSYTVNRAVLQPLKMLEGLVKEGRDDLRGQRSQGKGHRSEEMKQTFSTVACFCFNLVFIKYVHMCACFYVCMLPCSEQREQNQDW